jgi:hypothetical protein
MYSQHYKVGQHILDAFEVERPASATYPLAAAVGDLHLYARGPGVEVVFAKLLDHRGGAVDDLPGGDLLGHEGVQHLYLAQGTSVHRLHEHSTFPSAPDHANLLEARFGPGARVFEPIPIVRHRGHRYHQNLPIPSSESALRTGREQARACRKRQQGEGTPKSGDSGDGGDEVPD